MIKKIYHLTYCNKYRMLHGNTFYDPDIWMLSVMANVAAQPSYELYIFSVAEFPVQ